MRIGSGTWRGWRYRERFRFRLLAYCLMDNHVHLAVETGKAPLSRIMACLQSSYTQYFNRHYGRVGHLFQGRYKAFLVEKDRYALALLRYIDENPVKAGVAATAQAYRWSSDRDYREGPRTRVAGCGSVAADAWAHPAGGAAQLPLVDARGGGGILRRRFELGTGG